MLECIAGVALRFKWYVTHNEDDCQRYEFHRMTCDACRAEMRQYNRLAQAQTFDEKEWDKELADGQHP